LEESGQDTVKIYLGNLVGLLDIDPRGDIIRALISFWDSAHNVFHFSDFELTPTLEELAGYIGSPKVPMREQYLIAPRTVTIHKFLDTVKIRRVIHNPEL